MNDLVRMLWQDLMDKDDRNSPAEYPDHCLITFDELRRYIATALESAVATPPAVSDEMVHAAWDAYDAHPDRVKMGYDQPSFNAIRSALLAALGENTK